MGSRWNNGQSILDSIRSCYIHYAMIVWLLLLITAFRKRLSQRKHAEYPQSTDKRDYLSMVIGVVVGVLLYLAGGCILEIFLLAAGGAAVVAFLGRMKALDHRDQKELEMIRDRVENQIMKE